MYCNTKGRFEDSVIAMSWTILILVFWNYCSIWKRFD